MPLRCLVVGIGSLATGHYLPFLAAQDDVELAYLSRTPESAQRAAQQLGGVALASWADAASYGADVAFNLTTDTQHAAVLDELVRTGIPRVFTEKPLVAVLGQERVTEADFRRAAAIASAADAAHVELAMGFNYRFFDTVQRARQLIADGSFGALTAVVADAHYACWSHTIDLIGLTCGPLATLSALGESVPAGSETAPARSIAFVTSAGVTGTLSGTSRRTWADELLSISLLFERGRVRLRDLDVSLEVFDGDADRHTVTRLGSGSSRWDRYAASFRASLSAYLEAVRAGVPAPVGIDAGLRELQVEAAIARSIERGGPVDVQTEFPLPASENDA